eukprot:TRINITY_DN16479_c0_g1_i1.p1 TRINITY_DN16479_c0_g1~~TRINITY_DN16479_c0_g1_i1.p1  ORF type:complete len:154 (+),score=42.67 TRINITY_DN16479_c0_g1_i1:262-723(+)
MGCCASQAGSRKQESRGNEENGKSEKKSPAPVPPNAKGGVNSGSANSSEGSGAKKEESNGKRPGSDAVSREPARVSGAPETNGKDTAPTSTSPPRRTRRAPATPPQRHTDAPQPAGKTHDELAELLARAESAVRDADAIHEMEDEVELDRTHA